MKKISLRRSFILSGILIDSMVFTVLIVISLRLLIGLRGHAAETVLVGISLFIIVLLLRFRRLKKERRKKVLANERNERLEQLLLMDDETISVLLRTERFIFIRKARPDMFDILDAVAKGAKTIGMIESDEHMRGLIRKYGPQITVMTLDEMIAAIYGAGENSQSQNKHDKAIASETKYLILGIVLLTVSFAVGYKIYYRIISSACMLIALVLGVFHKHPEWKFFRIFLDNPGD